MTTFLFVQGLDPIDLAEGETFNKAKSRGNQALTGTKRNGEADVEGKKKPMDKLTFKTAEGGRISVNPEKFIGVGSDEEKDSGAEDE